MNIKTLSGYLAVLCLSFLLRIIGPSDSFSHSLLPVLMMAFPVIVGHRVKFRLSVKDTAAGLLVSAAILIPYYMLFGSDLKVLTGYSLLFQLIGIALPEEFFFRGFLQDSLGRNLQAILVTSLLFSVAHLPKAMFLGEWTALLCFFPSLVMGWLYMKTDNILPGTIFHLLANIVYGAASY